MDNKGAKLVLKQGNDKNQISLLGNRKKAGLGPRNRCKHQTSPPSTPNTSPGPSSWSNQHQVTPPTPSWVPDHTLGLPRNAEVRSKHCIPSLPVGKCSSSATEKASDNLLGKCQQEGVPDISEIPFPLSLSFSVRVVNFQAVSIAESKAHLGMCVGVCIRQGLLEP